MQIKKHETEDFEDYKKFFVKIGTTIYRVSENNGRLEITKSDPTEECELFINPVCSNKIELH
jgi:hypothetical protein